MTPPFHARRPTLLVVGCGDVGLRVLRLLRRPAPGAGGGPADPGAAGGPADSAAAPRGAGAGAVPGPGGTTGAWRVLALTSSAERCAELRAAGAVPLLGNLDQPATLRRLAGLADAVLHLAPPPAAGARDPRTAHLLQALARSGRCKTLVYGSTTGVYGDAGGARFDETRPVAPGTERARRRVDAEARLRRYGREAGVRVTLLRIPGIYAGDRPGGHPRERLARGTPVLRREDDVYTNHIHADDLARACVAALWHGRAQRVVNVCDDTDLTMGDYFDLAAELCGLPRPPRLSRAEAAARLSPMQLSFLGESRRLRNERLKRELRLRLRYPTVAQGLLA